MAIRIVGPREIRRVPDSSLKIDTTSHSVDRWTTGLSPFHLGPVPLYGGHVAIRMENAWQFSKVYQDQIDVDGSPSDAYWKWAKAGWSNQQAVRYPKGKGVKPAYCLWDGKRLGYVDARLAVYFKLYRDSVAKSEAFSRLEPSTFR